ncbi:transporter, DASS family [Proteiniphilum saccharofermentans]|uniref:Transporter, DASS family n=1 Tax=Proteiniphilum saccharofermentans TaxID=1642647 RepID=A0A1R3T4C2_9BACT|nr:DASS family sodium-coupled anion symporter [Proteiniphilum saccharofermentans]SCD22060.1 transporter, DASS family [Proteiniphilum saccharofermentans]
MEKETKFDPIDMNNYRIEKLPKMQKSGVEKWMAMVGAPLAIIVFALIYWVIDIPFLNTLSADGLDTTATARLDILGYEAFIRINYAMLAIFAAAIVLWITEALPNYLTSLLVIFGIVVFGVTTEKTAFAQLGHPVMWLNILSFVLASMLVKTQVAKRFALWFMVRFGKSASWIIFSFIIINIVLSAFISATTAKAAILLPIFMVIAAIYGATGGSKRNNFGRNLVLQNLFQINVGASGFLTGAGSNLLAAALMAGAIGGRIFSYQDWFVAGFPLAIILILIAWFVGSKIIFPLKEEEKVPQIEGGMERLKEELHNMGKMGVQEYKAIAIFVAVLVLWATDKQHGISQTTVAFAGAIVALLPKIGIVNWNEVDIPWHLMLFSAGAYALGVGLDATGLPGTIVNVSFAKLGITAATPFWVIYLVLTFLMLFSALIFQSKTMRTLIFIPIALGIEQQFGFHPLSLAFPVALLNNHVYVLPFNSKPAALLYTTDQYSWSDTFKFGFTMMIIAWVMIIVWGETVFRWLGYTNGLFF